ncbi:NADPH:quinone oxidoreductase family protein [Actinomadura bangladeshensis]|uniref:NADPH:quinone oxidoreductase family protein n=1 Tax=Actinomadura bangladeshensis TaxID=453573 RepID=A0A4R4PCQ9_9ACTN|nr:NADPH:quinone oxidoreductase family protein [Actinomadura bangladeshensis]TDC20338.1 NADPH:quinone oxidoreductase family protein [Actinomadura bangladeshensis]
MRAVRVTRTDGPESVEVLDVPEPVPGPGEVLVEVAAAGVAFPDLLMSRDLYQFKPELPFTLGGEVAGTVRTAPAGSGFSVGDRVAAYTVTGGFAPLATAPVDRVLPLPDGVGLVEASCCPLNYPTALFALRDRGGLREGQTVLVQGAAGGIGTASIQIARSLGARVISVVSSEEKADFVRRVGSHEVVLVDGFREAVDALTDGRGVDVVVDPVGGDRFTDSLRSLAPGGRLLVLGFTGGEIPTVKVNRLLLRNVDVRGVAWGVWANSHPGTLRKLWDDLMGLASTGAIDPPVHRTYRLDEAAEAVALLDGRGVLGKAVVVP